MEHAIITSRLKLANRNTDETKYSFCRAIAIHQELDTLGFHHKPAPATINWVLKRNGLTITQGKQRPYASSKRFYPEIKALHPGHVHQLDLVTPRYIKGFGVVMSVNRIDIFTAQANLGGLLSKGV